MGEEVRGGVQSEVFVIELDSSWFSCFAITEWLHSIDLLNQSL